MAASGRNLPLYGGDVRLTGIDISAGMLRISARKPASPDRRG
jgi:hypothetical protein